jgi:ATP-dependent DNA ligase
MIDESKMEAMAGGLRIGNDALNDSQLINLAKQYKKSVASRHRLLNEGDIPNIQSNALFASLKYDGQLHFLCKQGEHCFLFNMKGRVIEGLALLEEAKQALADYEQVILAGELYCTNNDNRPRVYEVSSALGAQGANKVEQLRFAAFDLLERNSEDCRALSFQEKQAQLNQYFGSHERCHAVEQQEVDCKSLAALYQDWIVKGNQEGIVCFDEANHCVYKIKPRHNIDAVILGFTESPDIDNSLRVLLTGLMRPDGSFQVFAKVGTGFDDEQRREFYTKLKALEVPSAFKTTDRNHTVFTMVRPEIVIEVAFHDLITESSSGKSEYKPVLTYDPDTGYSAQLPQAFTSVLGPVFKRIRDDKCVTPEDLRLTQLREFVDLDNLEAKSKSLDLAKSETLAREVYSKTTKGLVSVRKFLYWKTNKEMLDNSFPAFVFAYTDYSPGRKDPLKRVVRRANDETSAKKIFEEFKENEIKRGWKLVE